MGEHMDYDGPVQYLRLIGRLTPDGRLKLRPGYLTTHPQWVDREAGNEPNQPEGLVAELYDAEDRLLGRFPLRLQETCTFGGVGVNLAVRGFIPFNPNTAVMRFTYHGRRIHEIRRSRARPDLRIEQQPREHAEGLERITWVARHPEGQSLQFFLRYSRNGGETWQRVGWRTDRQEAEVDFRQLPGGESCLIEVVATDGINTVTQVSEPFSVPVKPLRAFIIAPVDGSVHAPKQTITFIGQGFDMEDNKPEFEDLIWVSSIDGTLGRGRAIQLASLSPGEHEILLLAGQESRQGSERIRIHVRDAGGSENEHSQSAA